MDKRKQAARRVTILWLLREDGMRTVVQINRYLDRLAAHRGTAANTIRRDLKALAAAGKVECKRNAVIGHEYGGGRNVSYDAWTAVEGR